ncbi:MAG: type VII secretion-associated protein [Corynebacterium sp.]|uniref:type VII secretion-associated protein n=1 Tax=Corynebacterium sp. TaxID=1720 RepID=UPI0026DCC99A|nr:type VII secretion-associated protein [Corynebacterium sp.]MDO5030074.1 type VII secretion-associated protein [Corynebacterium sp.]
MMKVDVRNQVTASEQLPTLRHGTWHLWGLSAPDDGEVVDIIGPRHLLDSMHTVIVPSYWGVPRQQRLALALLDAELNPYLLPLADAVLELDAPTVAHSIVVEVEPSRVCVTRVSGESPASRMTHLVTADDGAALVETVIALAYQLTVYPEQPLGMPDDVEVSGGRGITEYPPRWQEDIEFIVAEVPPGMTQPRRALLADRLRDRGFLVFDCPADRLAEPAEASALTSVHQPPADVEGADTADHVGTAATAGRPSGVVPMLVIATLLLLVVVISVVAWRVSEGTDSDIDDGITTDLPRRSSPTMSPPPEPPPEVTLTGAGVAVTFPGEWQLDPTSPLDRMTAVDGGDMRVLALAYPLTDTTTLDHVVAGLSSDTAADPTKSTPERKHVMGLDVVVVVERLPSGNSVVLWHHKIVDSVQISVGCQFRGSQIPESRPVCDRAVQSARPEL